MPDTLARPLNLARLLFPGGLPELAAELETRQEKPAGALLHGYPAALVSPKVLLCLFPSEAVYRHQKAKLCIYQVTLRRRERALSQVHSFATENVVDFVALRD
jgi:hypothetical protein